MDETKQFFDRIFEGDFNEQEVKDRLEEMYSKGETVEQIVAGAKSMIEHMVSIKPKVDRDLLDIVGTGGDGKSTLNISTIAAFVAAGAGCYVAKHCNRGVSSKFGSVDLLEELGVNVELPPEMTKELIETLGIGFMYAPIYHPAMRNVAKIRKEIGHRTIFNLLGPLTNPANAQTRLIGAYDLKTAEKLAHASKVLGIRRIIAAHSQDGLDEISADDSTIFFDTEDSQAGFLAKRDKYFPEDYSLSAKKVSLMVESAQESSDICRKILYDKRLTKRETMMRKAVELNAAFGIYLNKGLSSLYEGIKQAQSSIGCGAAKNKLEQLTEASK